jgi:hypothetical protein
LLETLCGTTSEYDARISLRSRLLGGGATISADIPIEVSYPRSEEYRMSSLYNERCRFVSAALRHAMASGAVGEA